VPLWVQNMSPQGARAAAPPSDVVLESRSVSKSDSNLVELQHCSFTSCTEDEQTI